MTKYTHIETVVIDEMTLKLGFYHDGKGWNSDVLEGETGTGSCYWGSAETLEQAIEKAIGQHVYSYYFFSRGYREAKAKMKKG